MTSNPTSNSSIPVMTPKNAPGNRSDIAWKHCISVVGILGNFNANIVEKVITGGFYQLKNHLAGAQKDV